jgi:hypothetical protein
MDKTFIIRLIPGLFVIFAIVFCLAATPRQVQAQDIEYPADSEKFSREELAQMLGPIALYPDKLLSQVLMASTYPLELIEADRWIRMKHGLQGDNLDRALLDKDWAPSVKAICHFPAILSLMSERIVETTNLGNAFLVQEAEVMDMIQELRASAHAQGNLTTTPQQKVIVEKETVIIEPANPRVIYVPYYDPYYIYGPWWYPAYPPYYWGPSGIRLGIGISYWPGIYFGFSWGTWSYFDWPRHYIFINVHDRPRYVRHDRWMTKSGRWSHVPVHRRGVAYRDKYTARKFAQYPQRRTDFRGDIRGFPERKVLDRQRSRVGDGRTRIERNFRDNPKFERSRQEQHRVERELQKRQQLLHQRGDRDLQKRPVIDRNRQEQQRRGQERTTVDRVLRERQERTRIDRVPRERQERIRIDRVPRERQERIRIDRVPRERQERTRIDSVPRERQRADQVRKFQQTDQLRRSRDLVKGEQSQRRRETVSDRQENGRSERQSSERGQLSRQERGTDFRSKSRESRGAGNDRNDVRRNRR